MSRRARARTTSFPSSSRYWGLADETGQLLSEYKKHLRDGEAHRLFKERVSEELGDLLWYIANVASKFDLTLGEIAAANLAKVKARWATERTEPLCFDASLPEGERLPRRFEVQLVDVEGEDRQHVRVLISGKPFGGELTDNAYDPDGYRFHDIFHFAYAAVLGCIMGAASATGDGGAAMASGMDGRAMGAEGCALFLVHRDDDWKITRAWAGIVGRDGIKPMIWYRLDENGKPVECED